MTELRAPDPNLDALGSAAIVGLDYGYGSPQIAHLVRWVFPEHVPVCADPTYGGVPTIGATEARWFAVPCRVCFPHAPLPGDGHDELCATEGCKDECGNPGLAWQVAVDKTDAGTPA